MAQSTRTLSVTKVTPSTSSGTVMSDVGGIDCGAMCASVYDKGTAVTLSATPGARSKFIGWTGRVHGDRLVRGHDGRFRVGHRELPCAADYDNTPFRNAKIPQRR